MKIKQVAVSFVFGVCSMMLLTGCDPEEGGVNVPVLGTSVIDTVTEASATIVSSVTSNGGASVTVRGVCWSTTPNPTIDNDTTIDGSGTGDFTSTIDQLMPDTTYYIRAYAINKEGTAYGAQVSCTTLAETVTDIDGNVYHTVTIGTQTWMVENLRTTKYRDGTPIPNVTDTIEWYGLTSGAYCSYEHSSSNANTYGLLYNWYAVNNSLDIAPEGWHVANTSEWLTLTMYLGGWAEAGGKLKETGTTHWSSTNAGATNEVGFMALPGGIRTNTGKFLTLGTSGYWWTKYRYIDSSYYSWTLVHDSGQISRSNRSKTYGLSVRCVKDE